MDQSDSQASNASQEDSQVAAAPNATPAIAQARAKSTQIAITGALTQAAAASWVQNKRQKALGKAANITSSVVASLPPVVQTQLARKNARIQNEVMRVASATTAFPKLANASISLSNLVLPAMKLGSSTPGLFAGEVFGSAAAVMWLAMEGKGVVENLWQRRVASKNAKTGLLDPIVDPTLLTDIVVNSAPKSTPPAIFSEISVKSPSHEAAQTALAGRAGLRTRLLNLRGCGQKETNSLDEGQKSRLGSQTPR